MADEVTPPVAPRIESAPPEGSDRAATGTAPRASRGDAWLVWGVSLGAIVVPVITLLTLDFLQHDSWRWNGVATAFDRGDFLVPVLILAADTVRRLWREVTCTGVAAAFRVLATIVCTVFCIACFVGIVVAAGTTDSTERTGIAQLTVGALIAALSFGTVTVGLPAREAS
jgi:hypothetical protein